MKRNQFDCDSCRYQFSVTLWDDLPRHPSAVVEVVSCCTYLICESRKGMSANQIKRTLGIQLQNSVISLSSHPRCNESCRAATLVLDGIVEMDETWVGGRERGSIITRQNKNIVIGIRQRGGDLRFFHRSGCKKRERCETSSTRTSAQVLTCLSLMTSLRTSLQSRISPDAGKAPDSEPQQAKSTFAGPTSTQIQWSLRSLS